MCMKFIMCTVPPVSREGPGAPLLAVGPSVRLPREGVSAGQGVPTPLRHPQDRLQAAGPRVSQTAAQAGKAHTGGEWRTGVLLDRYLF